MNTVILFIFMATVPGYPISLETVEFNDMQSCNQAAAAIVATQPMYDNVKNMFCLPKSIKPIKWQWENK